MEVKQNKSEFINYLWSVPRSEWTGVLETAVRSPINFFNAWEEMTGNSINLETSLRNYPLEHKSNGEYVLIAQTEWRGMHRLSVLADKPYRVTDRNFGTPEHASLVTWVELTDNNSNNKNEIIKV